MIRTDPDQRNLIDGTIVAYDPCEDGAYITFIGSEGPVIASVDAEDLDRLGGSIRQAVNDFDPDVPQEQRTRITERGIEVLRTLMSAEDSEPGNSDRMAGFSLYCEPSELLGASSDVIVGLGSIDDAEYAYVGTGGKESGYGDILLTRDQLGELIQLLSETYTAMGLDL